MAKAKKKMKSAKPMKKAPAKKAAKPAKKMAVKKPQAAKAAPKKAAPAKKAAKTSAKTTKTKSTPTKASAAQSISVKPKPISKIDYSKAVTPLGDRLIVRLLAAERVTAGGIIIPDTASTVQGHLKGEVLAAGTGNRNKKGQKRPLDVTVGDQIYFNEYSSTKINFGLEELHIVNETDVLGVAQ